jgi:chromosome partitioning protein
MLGRRRGRNRAAGPEGENGQSEVADAGPSLGTIPLSGDRIPDSVQDPEEIRGGIGDTISDVATAHAELDSVLPPESPVPAAVEEAGLSTVEAPEIILKLEHVQVEAAEGQPVVHAPPFDQAQFDPLPADPLVTSEPVPVIDVEEPAASTLMLGDTPSAADDAPGAPAAGHDEPATVSSPAGGPQPQSASGNPLPRVLAVANQKGGVGKTTTSVNLGAALAELGFRVLVIDLDPQGNATTGLGIDARNFELSMYDVLMRDSSLEDCVEPTSMKNLFVAPATIALAGAEIELVPAFSRELKLKRAIESVIDDFDYVLIDCPPSLGLITVNALAAAGEVLVPIQCEYYALEGLSQLMRNVHLVASNLNPKLDISTIVLTMYDARTKLSDQVANEVRLHFGSRVCRNVIPRTVRLSEAPSFGQPITAFDPASRGAIAYRELAKEVSGGAS